MTLDASRVVLLLSLGSALLSLAGVVRQYSSLGRRFNRYALDNPGTNDWVGWLARNAASELDHGLTATVVFGFFFPMIIAATVWLLSAFPWHPSGVVASVVRVVLCLGLGFVLGILSQGLVNYFVDNRRSALRDRMLQSDHPAARDAALSYLLVSELFSKVDIRRTGALALLEPLVASCSETLVQILAAPTPLAVAGAQALLKQTKTSAFCEALTRELGYGTPVHASRLMDILVAHGSSAVPFLVGGLRSDRALERGRSAAILGSIGNPAAVKPLLERLDDQDPMVREQVILALRAIDASALPTAHRVGGRVIEQLTKALCSRADSVRAEAIWGLADLPGGQCCDFLLHAPDEELARSALGRHASGFDAALVDALNAGHPAVVLRGAAGLTAQRDSRGHPVLRSMLSDGRPYVRWRAAEALGALGSAADVTILTPLQADDDALVRFHAAEAIARIRASTRRGS